MVIIELLLQVTGVVSRAEQVALLIMDKEEAEQLLQEDMVDLGAQQEVLDKEEI